jgi:hypothetical protein
MAGAYEYGAQPYRIPPEGETFMAFPKEKWPQYEPPPPAPNVFVFHHVQHPEIIARPYIRPTIADTREEITQILGKEFRVYLRNRIREILIEK